MAGLLGRSNGRASTNGVGLAACVCALGVLACATRPADPLAPAVTAEATASAVADAAPMPAASSASSATPLPPPVASDAASAAPSASATASAAASASAGSPVSIEVGEPKFTSGDVPKAKSALEKLAKKFKTCIDDNGGLTGPKGELELSFLVRAAGQAEGADVAKAKGIGDAAKKCVRDVLKKKSIGTPSDDPIGVTVVLKLTASK